MTVYIFLNPSPVIFLTPSSPLVPVGVDLGVVSPLLRDQVSGEDGLHRTGRLAGAAVDAGLGVDVQHRLRLKGTLLLAGMDAVNRADLDASGVLRVHARLSDHVRHSDVLPNRKWRPKVASLYGMHTRRGQRPSRSHQCRLTPSSAGSTRSDSRCP